MSWLNDIIGGSVNRAVSTVVNTFSPSMSRLASAGLPLGGSRLLTPLLGNADINFTGTGQVPARDWRVRVSTKSQALTYSGVMSPLEQTQGVIFPYTPQITVTHQANYTPQRLTHSNYPAYAYENSEVQAIQINAEFTVQNKNEASYLLACIYFFRTATKMFFGTGDNVGNPPPIVFLNGYGQHYFPNVPCLVTQFAHTMPADVDYIETGRQNSQDFLFGQSDGTQYGNFQENYADRLQNNYDSPSNSSVSNSSTRVPTTSTLSVSLQPVYSKKKTSEFDLSRFGSGDLIKGGFL